MRQYAKPLSRLIGELSKLPGIGGKTAQRLAFHILSLDETEVDSLAESMRQAKRLMHYCSVCGNLTEHDPCDICRDDSRDKTTICVVESPRDVFAMERIRGIHGEDAVAPLYRQYFETGAFWLLLIDDEMRFLASQQAQSAPVSVLRERNMKLYEEILP